MSSNGHSNKLADSSNIPRRESILLSAGELFAGYGYRGVGVDQIGAAAGITGPAIYRHFCNKESILVALFERLTVRLVHLTSQAQTSSGSHLMALEKLVSGHIDLAMSGRNLISVYLNEQSNLPRSVQQASRDRQREYIDTWCDLLGKVRDDLTPGERRVVVHGTISLINSIGTHRSYLTEQSQKSLLFRMALAALMA